MATKLVRITIDVELEKDVQDILTLAANRVHTIQGVANAFEVAIEDLNAKVDSLQIAEHIEFMKEKAPTIWERIKRFIRGD